MRVEYQSREEWLRARQDILTASDVAAILGQSPRGETAFDVYAKKKSGYSMPDNDPLLIGRAFESGISDVYHGKTGRPVWDPGDFTIYYHDYLPWLGATLDREVYRSDAEYQRGDGAPLELKHAGWQKRREWLDGCPLWVEIQLQVQMACSGASWGAYCGVVGGMEIHLGDIEFNRRFFDSAIPILDEFLWRLKNDEPPEIESHKNLASVKMLWADADGEMKELDEKLLERVNRWEEAKAYIREAKQIKDKHEAVIRSTLGENTFGILSDGTMLVCKETKRGRTLRRTKQ